MMAEGGYLLYPAEFTSSRPFRVSFLFQHLAQGSVWFVLAGFSL